MNVADRIQSLRKSKGISQEQLADDLGVSRQAVSKWESEQSTPDMDKIVLMSDYFEVTTDYILKGIEPVPVQLDHTTVGDVLDKKVLTKENGARMKKIIRYVIIGILIFLGIDLISLVIYFLINGFPN